MSTPMTLVEEVCSTPAGKAAFDRAYNFLRLQLAARAICTKALKKAKQKAKRRASAKARRVANKILCDDMGLSRVRGCVSGETFYE